MNQCVKNFVVAAVAVAALILPAGAASADQVVLYAMEDNDAVNEFTLTFPDLGLTTTSKIVATRYRLEIDDAGVARFADYYQLVEPLTLPLGISTGAITVRIKSSTGHYDPGSHAVTTQDQYEISFTNDLSAFDFTSPVVIEAQSSGTLKNSAADALAMNFTWEGSGSLPNTSNPSQPYKYTYVCTTSSRFGDPSTFPAIPSITGVDLCGAGACGSTGGLGLGLVPFLLGGRVVMRMRVRRRRR
jgi:hypothetical protein